MDDLLIPVLKEGDILPGLRDTPVGDLLRYQNLGMPYREHSSADLLVGMCMDNRKKLHIPENFAFIFRTAGANLRRQEFNVSFAVAVGGVKAIALIGHSDCGMVNLESKRAKFIEGLTKNGGWNSEEAETHFDRYITDYEIGNAIGFVLIEAERLRKRYPNILIVPLYYTINDGLIHQVREE